MNFDYNLLEEGVSMITTVTLNPSIDRSYIINNFTPNNSYDIENVTITIEGKGINIAKIASNLGCKLNATGFLGGVSGDYIKKQLTNLDIEAFFVNTDGESKNLTAIIDPVNNTQTTVNEGGPEITREELTKFIKEYIKILKYSKIIIAAGSVPKGVPKTIYRDMVKIAKDNNVLPIIDASGNYLEEVIKAKPYMIKPNMDELNELVGYNLKNEYEIVHELKYICKQGVELVAFPLEGKGTIFATNEKVLKLEIPDIKPLNICGYGDALIAGFSVAMINNYDIKNAFKYSVACGVTNSLKKEVDYIDKNYVDDLFNKVEVTVLE